MKTLKKAPRIKHVPPPLTTDQAVSLWTQLHAVVNAESDRFAYVSKPPPEIEVKIAVAIRELYLLLTERLKFEATIVQITEDRL